MVHSKCFPPLPTWGLDGSVFTPVVKKHQQGHWGREGDRASPTKTANPWIKICPIFLSSVLVCLCREFLHVNYPLVCGCQWASSTLETRRSNQGDVNLGPPLSSLLTPTYMPGNFQSSSLVARRPRRYWCSSPATLQLGLSELKRRPGCFHNLSLPIYLKCEKLYIRYRNTIGNHKCLHVRTELFFNAKKHSTT